MVNAGLTLCRGFQITVIERISKIDQNGVPNFTRDLATTVKSYAPLIVSTRDLD